MKTNIELAREAGFIAYGQQPIRSASAANIDRFAALVEQGKPKRLTPEQLMDMLPDAVRLPPGWKQFADAIQDALGIPKEDA